MWFEHLLLSKNEKEIQSTADVDGDIEQIMLIVWII